jgi:hypothetical protein
MAVKVGAARINEKGTTRNGKAGDQTGKEIMVQNWYSKPWNVMLVCKDKKIANRAAAYMEAICADPSFGYDQGQRTTGYNAIKKAGSVSGASASEFDCSSLVLSCYRLAGLNVSVNGATGNMVSILMNTDKFEKHTSSSYLRTSAYCEPGAVYVKEGAHTVMGLTRGSKAHSSSDTSGSSSSSSSSKPSYTVGNTYTCQVELKVRTGAGTDNRVKKHSELSADGRKHDKDNDGAIDRGTRVTCKALKTVGNDIWMKTASGWMAAYYRKEMYIA